MTDQQHTECDLSGSEQEANKKADDLPSPFEMSLAFADESNLQAVFEAISNNQDQEST